MTQKILSLRELLKNVKKIEGSKLNRDTSYWLGVITILNAHECKLSDEVFEAFKKECEEYAVNSALIRDLFEKK